MKFYKIKRTGKNYITKSYWVTEGLNHHGEIWINMSGGWSMKEKEDEILEIVDFPDKDSFEDAYRKEIYSYLIKPDSDLGWLSPEGDFYGCDWADHNMVANLYFNKTDLELEKEGWVKIFRSVELGEPVYCQNRLSTQQRIWIEDHDVKYHYC